MLTPGDWANRGWAFGFHDETWLGYLVTATYLMAALAAWRAGLVDGPLRSFWRFMASSLLALGINKQLDLQSALIVLARTVAREQGWFAYRRAVQYGFAFACLLMAVGATIWAVRWLKRRSVDGTLFSSDMLNQSTSRRFACALAGSLLLGAYILLRITTISHGVDFLPLAVRRDASIAIVELIALLLLIAGATGGRRTDQPFPDDPD